MNQDGVYPVTRGWRERDATSFGMEGPGISLFQGSDSIQLNTTAQRQEEDEEQEDIKRRNEEIKNILTNAFDDLDNDDDEASSVNSSRCYNDVTRDTERSHAGGLVFETTRSESGPTVSQIQREFGVYGRVDASNDCNDQPQSNFEHQNADRGPTISDIQREYGVYGQPETPYSKNTANNMVNSLDSPYELPKPSNPGYPHNIRAQLSEGYTFPESYPANYKTPTSRFGTATENYRDNGYIDNYEKNGPYKAIQEFGGGDSEVTSDHFQHCFQTSPNGGPVDENTAYKTAEYNSNEQLQVLYSVRMREIQRLTEELQQLQEERKEETSQLSRKLALAQAEVERSNLSRNQAQNLLVDAKVEIGDLQAKLAALKENVAVLEKTKQNMGEELSISKNSVADLQQKIAVLERVQMLQTTDKTHEKFLKQAQEKHTIEMKNMQIQIDALTDKLNAKETSYVALEHKLADVRRAHETLMVDKGDTMNRLSRALEESQAQCRHLMASHNVQEVTKLETQLRIVTEEKDELVKTVHELQRKLDLAKSDITQYDSLLATTCEEESDSMRQLKLGELHNRSKSKPADDITNKLRGELQRCLAGQAVKRKEINRLENTLAQKEREVEQASSLAQTCQEEAARYARRVNELEMELKSLLTDKAMKANAEIQKLSDHLNDTKKLCDNLQTEKNELERKLQQALVKNEENLRRVHQEILAEQEKEAVGEYNKEYLEIHEKAVQRVRQEAQVEIVQLSVQLEQTQKELDRVKELYVDVCGTKEQLIAQHQEEIAELKVTYADFETHKAMADKMNRDLETQASVIKRLTKECELYRSKTVELEKDLSHERQRREEHAKRIHVEIERTKEETLKELRNAYPNRNISVILPDHCSEHVDKITQLEDDCKRLEEKLSNVVEERKKMSELQTNLDDARLKIAQLEIAHESLKKKCEDVARDRNSCRDKISALELELLNAKRSTQSNLQESSDIRQSLERAQSEYESLQKEYDSVLRDRNTLKDKLSSLEIKQLQGNTDVNSNSEERMILLANESRRNDEQLQLQSKEINMLKEERDQLVVKLKDQARQFERYVKSQMQVSVELNNSPRSLTGDADLQKMREIAIKEVREEMEEKVTDELKGIEEQHKQRQKEIEEQYKTLLLELQSRCREKTEEVEAVKETMIAERLRLQSRFKAQEQTIAKMIEAKLEKMHHELVARKIRIESLLEELRRREIDMEEQRNVMAQVMSEWASEIRSVKTKEAEMNQDIEKLKQKEEALTEEVKDLKQTEEDMKSNINMLKHKYQSARKTAQNYKELAENKEKFFLSECERIKEGYKRAMNQVQQKVDAIVSSQEKQVSTKMAELESQYEEQLEQMRLKMKYKNKC
ncbi:centrosomal protein of 152 kDa-like isoform X1 [Neodiprion lecontei]|uniref:Centrosomal protein of 152 kDa-like isoform X1 n=2 Tax=Neodiprion lecontei TaxID=441921 RepID=A0ABM3GNQ3_NEOLC|nr:centrosomal protein of 152 kDa-like isoform X1 [Neodiprion lecontei]